MFVKRGFCLICLTIFLILECSVFAQNAKIDSLQNALKNAKHDTTRAIVLLAYIEEIFSTNPDTIIPISEQVVQIVENNLPNSEGVVRLTFLKSKALALSNIGVMHQQHGNAPGALEYCHKSLEIYEKIGDKKSTSSILSDIASIYDAYGDTANALEYYHKSLNIVYQRTPLNNIGALYSRYGQYDKALEYFNKCLKLAEDANNRSKIAYTYNNIGRVYGKKGDTEKGIKYNLMGLKIYEELNDKAAIAQTLQNIGTIYSKGNDIGKALEYLHQSLKINEKIQNKIVLVGLLYEIGSNYRKGKQYAKAKEYVNKSLQLAKEIGYMTNISSSSRLLSEIYAAEGDYKNAYEMHKLHKQMADSIKNNEAEKAMEKKHLEYEYEKQAQQLKQKQTEEEAALKLQHQHQIQQKNYWIYGSLALLLLLSIAGAGIYSNNKQKQKVAAQQNIVLEQKLLRSQMNPHFIFNSLGIIHEYVQTHKSELAGEYLVKFSRLMRLILENSRQEFVSFEKELETLTHYLTLNQLVLRNRFTYQINIDDSIDREITSIPPMLAQPFIENALKHGIANSNKPGELIINFRKVNQTIVFEVLDNGIGYTKSELLKKETGSKQQSLATQIVYERLENINKNKQRKIQISVSDLTDTLRQITGTKVEFEIPIVYSV